MATWLCAEDMVCVDRIGYLVNVCCSVELDAQRLNTVLQPFLSFGEALKQMEDRTGLRDVQRAVIFAEILRELCVY